MINNNYNVVDLIRKGLETELAKVIHEQLVDKLVNDFRAEANKLVAEYTAKITMKGVESFRDCQGMRDELRIYINGVDVDSLKEIKIPVSPRGY